MLFLREFEKVPKSSESIIDIVMVFAIFDISKEISIRDISDFLIEILSQSFWDVTDRRSVCDVKNCKIPNDISLNNSQIVIYKKIIFKFLIFQKEFANSDNSN